MSLTQVATATYNTGIHVSQWQQKLLMRAGENLFWENLSGAPGSGMPIIRNDDLTAKRGGIVHIPMQRRMSGAGVTGNSTLSGNEEAMVFDDLAVTISQKRNAALVSNADQQKTIHDLREAAGMASSIWLAEKIDNDIFDALDGQTTNRLYGGDATAKSELVAGDTFSAALIAKARSKAKSVHVRPLRIMGREYYILVLHPFQAADLRQDSTWLAAQQYAAERGADNPILAMTMGSYQGVLVFENDRVEYGSDGGSGSVEYAIGHLVGADAVGFAWADLPRYIQDVSDYGDKVGAGAAATYGLGAAVFNSVPVGHVPIMTAAADPNS